MRQSAMLLTLFVALLGMVTLSTQPIAVAQEATPVGVEIGGVAFEPVGLATGIDLPHPGDLFVGRAVLAPGGVVPIAATDPALGILLVESGTLTVWIDAPMTVTRGAGAGESMATAQANEAFGTLLEAIPAGEAATLAAGDAAYIPAQVAGEIRNEGQEPAIRLAILVLPSAVMTSVATPTP